MRLGWVVFILVFLLSARAESATRVVLPAYVTDSTIYMEPFSPQLDAAGSKNIDQIFRKQVIRLTDSNDSSTDCTTIYSNQPAFNLDNTKVAVLCTVGFKRFKVFDWDSATNTASNGRINTNLVSGIREYMASWSKVTPNKFYTCADRNLYEFSIPSGASTAWSNALVKDLSATIGGGASDYCEQLSVSADDDVFAMHYNVGGTNVGYLVYKKSTDTVLLNVNTDGTINEVEIDKSGRYLVVLTAASAVYVWDLQGIPVKTTVTADPFNHRAMGNGVVVSDCLTRALCIRNLSTPNSVTKILADESWSYAVQQDHLSIVGTSDAWVLSCRYATNNENVSSAYDNECVQVATDGSQVVRRLLHHHSNVFSGDYDAQPKASMSMDGRYIAFTSNWEGFDVSTRNDVFIMDLSVDTSIARDRSNATTRSNASTRVDRTP